MSGTIFASQNYEIVGAVHHHSVVYRLPSGEQSIVWWDLEGPLEFLPHRPSNDDLAAVSLLFLAMHGGMNLHIEGKVSKTLLDRVEEFVRIWSLWRPNLYRIIRVTADEEVADRTSNQVRESRAIAAFSGGVDAASTAWTHSRHKAGRSTRNIFAGVLIQGFDIPLDGAVAFSRTKSACRAMLDDLDIPMVTLRTNWKTLVCVDWEMEFGLGVFSCLKLWEDEAGSLLVGSCEDYSRLVVPWGSHPLPTAMLSSKDVSLVYDGGHLNRTQKVRGLSEWSCGYDLLRVCWEGDITGENCGECEKCLRTKLNAMVIGSRLPKSLGAPPTARQVARIGPMNIAQKALFEEIIEEANLHGFSDQRMLEAMRTAMNRKRAPARKRARQWASSWKGRLKARLAR